MHSLILILGLAYYASSASTERGYSFKESSKLTQNKDGLSLEEHLHQLNQRLSMQEDLTLHLSDQIQKMDERLNDKENTIRELEAKLSQQEFLVGKQHAQLSQQESLLSLQRERTETLVAEHLQHATQLEQLENKVTWLQVNCQVNIHDEQTSEKRQGLRHPTSLLTSDVMARSDDGGPLEVVVSHLSQKVTEMITDIQTLKNVNTRHDQDIQNAQTSVYTRWGSSHCPTSSHLIYTGVIGGSDFHDKGAATNYLCLTMSPVSGPTNIGSAAHLVGAEYEIGGSQQNEDPVCSVCRSSHSTTIMIPGTNVCTQGWHLEYSGFLMAGATSHEAGSEYICVDSGLESLVGSADDHNGKLLYGVTAVCGSLPCRPYVSGEHITCAVCSL